MEPNTRDLIDDAIANAVDAGYIYVECAGCGEGGYWAKPGKQIACPLCDHPITAPTEPEKPLIDQVREWREMFTGYCDSHIGAIGYQVCERLIEELQASEQLIDAMKDARRLLATSRTVGGSPDCVLAAENALIEALGA